MSATEPATGRLPGAPWPERAAAGGRRCARSSAFGGSCGRTLGRLRAGSAGGCRVSHGTLSYATALSQPRARQLGHAWLVKTTLATSGPHVAFHRPYAVDGDR